MIKKRKKILIAGIVVFIIGVAMYFTLPRFNVENSKETIKTTTKAIEDKKVVDQSFVATLSVPGKVDKVYVYDNSNADTLFSKGAGIQSDISTDFKAKDYTYVRGHVETVFKDLDKVKVNDIIDVTLKNGQKLKYKVTKIHIEKYKDNSEIFTYTDSVGLSVSTCSKTSINKQYPEKVLVVDALLV